MPPGRGDQRRHILVESGATAEPYKYPHQVRGGAKIGLPPRTRQDHGEALLKSLDALRTDQDETNAARRAIGISEDRGIYLQFESDPDFDLAIQSLDRTREGIELVAVKRESGVHLATVYVPQGKLQNLMALVSRYVEEDDARWGKPKNKTLVESVSGIRRAALESFWTDDRDRLPKEGDTIWWEVWLRAGQNREQILDDFRSHSGGLGLRLKREVLRFAERTVLLAFGTPEQMASSVQLLDCIAELRRAKAALPS
jgi:hypothetical protein